MHPYYIGSLLKDGPIEINKYIKREEVVLEVFKEYSLNHAQLFCIDKFGMVLVTQYWIVSI